MTHPAIPEHLPDRRAPWARMRPDWIILGVDAPPGVQIFASNELSEATLELLISESRPSFDTLAAQHEDTVRGVRMTATGKSYVMTFGNTYAEAIAALFSFWKPESGQKAIGR